MADESEVADDSAEQETHASRRHTLTLLFAKVFSHETSQRYLKMKTMKTTAIALYKAPVMPELLRYFPLMTKLLVGMQISIILFFKSFIQKLVEKVSIESQMYCDHDTAICRFKSEKVYKTECTAWVSGTQSPQKRVLNYQKPDNPMLQSVTQLCDWTV